jgi:hypothetical protein
MIRDKAVTGSYVTKRELINCIRANFRANRIYWWIHCFLRCRPDDVSKAVVGPGEPPRLRVPRRYPDQYMGIHNETDLQIQIAHSPYVTKEAFFEYARDVIVLTVEANRDLPGCQAKPPILFCNNCFCHCFHDILQELAHRGILLLTYPSHTSYIFWLLDVMLLVASSQPGNIYHAIRSWICKLTTRNLFYAPRRLRQKGRE